MNRTTPSHRSWARALIALLAVMLVVPARPHNNAVVHPEITDAALRLLRLEDMAAAGISSPSNPDASCDVNGDTFEDCYYQDLWTLENRGPLREPAANAWTDPGGYETAYQNGDDDIIMGSVIEDGWNVGTLPFVLNHFFHGRSNSGLTNEVGPTFHSSRHRAEVLFHYALDLHEYTTQSQDRAWIYLGRFLHHVEDMSSPAHVHNDKHPPHVADDDYEGIYVPEVMWANGSTLLHDAVSTASPVIAVDTPDLIWPPTPAGGGPPPSGTLAGLVYNTSSYWGNLDFPMSGDAATPGGELAEMFPDDTNGLRYDPGIVLGPRWIIDGIGAYHHLGQWSASDAWWPDAVADEDAGSVRPDNTLAPYYIENLNDGDQESTAVIPPYHRTTYSDPWDPTSNPVILNSTCVGGSNDGLPCYRAATCPNGGTCTGKSFVKRQSEVLLQPPVQYVAGAARWWYDIANLPPYLQRVEATQAGPVPTKYDATWTETPVKEWRELPEIGIIINTWEQIDVVKDRSFDHNPLDRLHISNEADLTIKLTFNEPIRTVSELKLLNTAGVEQRNILSVVASQATNNVPVRTNNDTEWAYTIEASNIDLNGEMVLMVKAQDKNNHFGPEGGELDQSPATPAKRDTSARWTPTTLTYPWHTDTSNPAFTYDHVDGDRNHRLLFDSEDPMTTIGVTPP